MNILDGKRALVTGASRGVGYGIARAMAAAGATVIATARSADRLQVLATEVRAEGGRIEVVCGDLSSREGVALVAKKSGVVDILVNNAAYLTANRQSLLYETEQSWSMELAVNLTAPVLLIQHCVPGMVKRGGGTVINISSIAARRPNPTNVSYAAAKAALEAVTRGLAVDNEARGVRFNAVALGITNTEIWDDMPIPGMTIADIAKLVTPLGRATEVSEVAALCVYLSSDAAAPITGTTITMDGGMTAGSFSPQRQQPRKAAE